MELKIFISPDLSKNAMFLKYNQVDFFLLLLHFLWIFIRRNDYRKVLTVKVMSISLGEHQRLKVLGSVVKSRNSFAI